MFLLALLSLPTFMYLIVQQSDVQQFIVHEATRKLSSFLGTRVTIKKADIDLFDNITFHDFCVRTPGNDTILFTPELTFRLNSFTLSSRYLEIKKVTLNKPLIHFQIDSLNQINFQFIIDKLEAKDTVHSKNPLILAIHDIRIKDAHFDLVSYSREPKNSGINFGDLHLDPLNMNVTGFCIDHGIVDMNIRNLSGIEKSGFILRNFASQLKIFREFMVFNHLSATTNESHIEAQKVHFSFDNFKEFKTGIFGKKVKLDINLEPSEISSSDLAYFSPAFQYFDIKADVSGKFSGVLNDLKAKNLDIKFGTSTHFRGNININGLPKVTSAFIYADIKKLTTSPGDIQHIKLPRYKVGHITLPGNFKTVSFLNYKGKFTGFVTDFVAYGTIQSNLGNVESDLSFKPDTAGYFKLNGRLITNNFDLGTFVHESKMLGTISLNALVNGQVSGSKNMKARLDGNVESVYLNGYDYHNIKLDGTLSNKKYDGSVIIADPNLDASFDGKINLSVPVPVFNFAVSIQKANLYKLHFDKSDTTSFMSFFATADFTGSSIDDSKGKITLLNSTFRKTNKEIHVNNFLLYNQSIEDTNHIYLRSDLADAEITGVHHYKNLVHSFRWMVHRYLPSLVVLKDSLPGGENNFRFVVNLKDTRQLTDYFVPGLYISKDTKLTGNFNSVSNSMNFLLKIPLLQHQSKKWYNVYFNGTSQGNQFRFSSGCNTLKINNSNKFDNLTILTDIRNDSIQSKIRWNNWDTIVYRGDVSFLTSVHRNERNSQHPVFTIQLDPSRIVMKDTSWDIRSGPIALDSTEISIRNFYLEHHGQTIAVNGKISEDPAEKLDAVFKNINLGNLKTIFKTQKWEIGGVLNGKAVFSGFYKDLLFHAGLNINDLAINSENLGDTRINAVFDNASKNINIDAKTKGSPYNAVYASGLYSIISKNVNFGIQVNHLKVKLFEPFISGVFSNIHGDATGKVTLSGPVHAPVLNGRLRLDSAGFVVNYLNTPYHFGGVINVDRNRFLLRNTEVFDGKNNKAFVNGSIFADKFKDVSVDVTIDAHHLWCLNTSEMDNSMYYGQGFATGIVHIKGEPKNLDIDIAKAVTDKGTRIYIPLETKSELRESDFIHFASQEQVKQPFAKYEIDTTTDKDQVSYLNGGLKFNLNLEVTPDADVQLVFDQKIGDIIHGNGTGNLNLKLDDGTFNMYGNFRIAKADYLFTLGNLINKNFIIEPGGTVSWNGNPMDATINIQAIYQLYASLYDLVQDLPTSGDARKRIKVDCRIFLTDKLMNPTIRYDIKLPSSNQETQNLLNAVIGTQEELTKQFAALLITGGFMSNSSAASAANSSAGNTALGSATSTSLEFVSNQFSRWLSQFSKDLDISLNYRPADMYTNPDMQFGLAKQFGDKVSFRGNLDVGGGSSKISQANTQDNNIVPEGELDVKLTRKISLKAFNRSNQSFDRTMPYTTQGVAIIFKEDFNSFSELLHRYYSMIFKKKDKNPVRSRDNKNDVDTLSVPQEDPDTLQ